MPWCPKCGAEFREGFIECSDCFIPLGDEPPKPKEKKPRKPILKPEFLQDPVILTTVSNHLTAQMILSFLEAFDVPAACKSVFYTKYPIRISRMNNANIFVERTQLEFAKQILEDWETQDDVT